ncbi:hypothetical protein GCM10022393_05010 [Aquimarina addita]|uniref:F5/8 type C domain-containing protein n=1 Tax=Aquimarina addita TaxID=870485 RepID=A0ABP7XAJ9_9FLAO
MIRKTTLLIITILCFCVSFSHAQTTVSTDSELQTAISNATAGTTIILADGIWTNTIINISKTGTASAPITIKAETPGSVFFEGNSHVRMSGSYIIFEGVVFQNPMNLTDNGDTLDPVIEFRTSSNNECDNCIVTNIKIDTYNGTEDQLLDVFKWIIVYGQHNEISYSSFIGKYGVGSIINDNRNETSTEFAEPDYTRIHHNYFADRIPVLGEVNLENDQDAIRIGNSSTSLHPSNTEVYENLFNNWSGEVEIISNKSGENKYYNNTFRDYQGSLTLRHGDDCEVYNNYFFADNNLFSGAIRVIGEGHKVYNNYIEGVNSQKPNNGGTTKTAGGINVSNGRPGSALNGYYQVKNATIVNNTFVNCDYGLRVGTNVGGDLSLAPENLIIANNILINTSENAVDEQTAPTGTSFYEGNLTQNGSWDLTNGTNGNQTISSGLLDSDAEFYRLASGSAAIDAGLGTYSFLTEDILGGGRTSAYDAGAEEFGAMGSKLPYTTNDVGVQVGFLASQISFLRASVSDITLEAIGGNASFIINSDVNWTISDDAGWLTVNPSTGVDNETINVTATRNSTGLERTATITITENGGTLSTTINVVQEDGIFDPNNPEAITINSVTAVGSQDESLFPPSNTIDEDPETRWSGNSSDGSAYLTYDLGCEHIITSVNIFFHKGDERTSNFKVLTSIDGINFTDQTSQLGASYNATTGYATSTQLSTEAFEEFALANTPKTRYIRIAGYGNSEGSGWNSYEEVAIYGDANCEALSVEDATFSDLGISIFPVPVSDGFLSITSNKQIGLIQGFDLTGRKVLETKILTTSAKLNVTNLVTGTYVLKIGNASDLFVIK